METSEKEGLMKTVARVSPLAPFLFFPDNNPPKVSIRAMIFWGIIVYALQAFLVLCIAAISLNDKIQETGIFKSPADAPVSARGVWNCTPLSSWDTRALWPGSGAAKTYAGGGGAFSAVGQAAMSASECKAKVKEAGFCTAFAEGYVGPTGKCCIWGLCVNGDTELPPCGGLIQQDERPGGYCDSDFINSDPAFTSCNDLVHNGCGKAPPICNLPSPPANTGWKNPMMGYQKSTAVLDLTKLETKLLDIGTPIAVNDPDGWRSTNPRNENYKSMPFKTVNYRLEVRDSTLQMPISTECDKNVWCAQTHPEDLTAEQIHDWQDGKMLVTMGASGIKNVNAPMLALSTCALLPSPELRQVFTTAHEVEIGDCNTVGFVTDFDSDGMPDYPDYLDPDKDGDGIPDASEGTTADTDSDYIPDFLDLDGDGDGIPDAEEGTVDTDRDGIPNYLDPDSDGDGIPDADEGTMDHDFDGIPDFLDFDTDGDGIPDAAEGTVDTDRDGMSDRLESNVDDTDSDGTPEFLDPDSQNWGRRLPEEKAIPSPSTEPHSSSKSSTRSETTCSVITVDPAAFWRSTCGAQKLPYGQGYDEAFVVYQKADPWSPLSFPVAWSASCMKNCTELLAGLEDERMDTCSDMCGTSFRNSANTEIKPKELRTGEVEYSCTATVDKVCDEVERESGPFQCVRYVSPSYLTIVSAAYSNTMTAMIVLAPALAFLAIKLHGHTAPEADEGKQPNEGIAQRWTL